MGTNKNINFVLVGAKATGKTVYLASLFLNTKMITSKDAKTTKYLKQMSDTLVEGKYPNATSGALHNLIFDYKDNQFNCNIKIDDVDGHFIETLSEEDEHTQLERDRLIRTLKTSEGIFFFFPYSEKLNEKSIKDFSDQIDTIIFNLKKIYNDRGSIPIPATILVSKWDESPYYKSEDEEQKAIEYIESSQFLKRAKDKIEQYFQDSKVIPLSAIGSNIKELNSYNLEKPIQFSLNKIYSSWIDKINMLEGDELSLLSYLSNIYDDIQFYEDGKYKKLYKTLEKKYAEKFFKELSGIKNIKEYKLFEEKNQKVVNSLLLVNRTKLEKVVNKIKNKHRFKIALGIVAIIIIFVAIFNNYSEDKMSKKQSKLFENIVTNYENHNYKKTLDDIKLYQENYSHNTQKKHSTRIIAIKNLIKKSQTIAKANSIILDIDFKSIEKIDKVFTSFSDLGIDEKEIIQKLVKKKHKLVIKNEFNELKSNIEKLGIEEATLKIEQNWKDEYQEENKEVLRKALNKQLNEEVHQLLENISKVTNMDEYKNIMNTLHKIQSLKTATGVKKINFLATINDSNLNQIKNIEILKKRYQKVITYGLSNLKVYFGANYAENKPLGFNCSSEEEILLNIGKYNYKHEDNINCSNITMSWNPSSNIFKQRVYPIKITEINLINNSHYDTASLRLSKNDLIDLYNAKYIKKDIGNGYFIGFQRK